MSIAGAYAFFRNLSLDVVVGAMVSGNMVAWMMGHGLPGVWWIVLPVAVWVIYTTDHLLDAYRLKEHAHTSRHLFHHRYFRPLLVIWLLLLLTCLTVAPFFVPRAMLYLGLGMGALVLVHLGLVQWVGDRVGWFFHKELGVALIYSGGVWGGPLVLYPEDIDLPLVLMGVQFLLLALTNLLFFSLYEAETDRRDGHTSFALFLGTRRTRWVIGGIGLLFMGLAAFLALQGLSFRYGVGEGILLGMCALLLAITFWPAYFGKAERYRFWGDGAFLLPVLVVFF